MHCERGRQLVRPRKEGSLVRRLELARKRRQHSRKLYSGSLCWRWLGPVFYRTRIVGVGLWLRHLFLNDRPALRPRHRFAASEIDIEYGKRVTWPAGQQKQSWRRWPEENRNQFLGRASNSGSGRILVVSLLLQVIKLHIHVLVKQHILEQHLLDRTCLGPDIF